MEVDAARLLGIGVVAVAGRGVETAGAERRQALVAPDAKGKPPQVCDLAWGTWLVSKGGEVKPCCFIEWEFGNAFTDDPERIANGPEARELRRRLMSGDLPRECRGCGCAQPLTEPHQRAKLDEAERLLAESDLSEERRRELTGIITERRAMIEERWGARATA